MQSAILEAFVRAFVPLAATAIAGGLTWCLAQAGLWLQARAKASKLAAVGVRIEHLAEVVVTELEATVRPTLVTAAATGHLTPADAAMMKQLALDRLKTIMSIQGTAELEKTLGIFAPSMNLYLGGVIEKAVSDLAHPIGT